MTASAVRAWLAATIAPVGIAVYDSPLVVGPAGDFVSFQRFPARRNQLTFGAAGSLQETEYTPSLLVALMNPSNDGSPAGTLDGYVDAICELLTKATLPAVVTDPLTGEQSEIVLLNSVAVDPAPANTLTGAVLVPSLTEYSVQSA